MTRPLPHDRSPASPADEVATYPVLSLTSHTRRRFLKLCALSSASAVLGLELTGCPGGTGGGSGGGGGVPDWLPWPDGQDPDAHAHIAGEVAMPMDQTVAVVCGGGPVAVTFKDGAAAELVVVATVTTYQGRDVAAEFSLVAKQHADLVRKAALEVPGSAIGKADSLQAFEDVLKQALDQTLQGDGYVEEVTVGKAQEKKAAGETSSSDVAAQESMERAPEREEAADIAPAEEAAAPAPAPVPAGAKALPKVKALWTPCRKPGCKSCG